MIKVKFKQWNCIAVFVTYANNGRTCIRLIEEKTGEPIATATVNISEVPLLKNQIAIKDYSENNGMANALQKAGIIGDFIKNFSNGYVKIGVYELLKTE